MLAGRLLSVGNRGIGAAILTVVLSVFVVALSAFIAVLMGWDNLVEDHEVAVFVLYAILLIPVYAFALNTGLAKAALVYVLSSLIQGVAYVLIIMVLGVAIITNALPEWASDLNPYQENHGELQNTQVLEGESVLGAED